MNLRRPEFSDCAKNGTLVWAENETEKKLPIPCFSQTRKWTETGRSAVSAAEKEIRAVSKLNTQGEFLSMDIARIVLKKSRINNKHIIVLLWE